MKLNGLCPLDDHKCTIWRFAGIVSCSFWHEPCIQQTLMWLRQQEGASRPADSKKPRHKSRPLRSSLTSVINCQHNWWRIRFEKAKLNQRFPNATSYFFLVLTPEWFCIACFSQRQDECLVLLRVRNARDREKIGVWAKKTTYSQNTGFTCTPSALWDPGPCHHLCLANTQEPSKPTWPTPPTSTAFIISESLFPLLCGRVPEAGQEHGDQVLQMAKAATSTSVCTSCTHLYSCQCSCCLLRACELGLSTSIPRYVHM